MTRPIGTEFWYRYPPQLACSNKDSHEYLYRVTGHSSGGHGTTLERVEPIASRTYKVVETTLDLATGGVSYRYEDGSVYHVNYSAGWAQP